MEQSHSAIMIVDLGSRIEYANAGLCHQIGYSRRELIGRPWRDFQVVDTPAEILADLVSTVRLGRPWQGEWFNRRKDGAVYPVRGVITPVKNRNGSLACFVAVFDDMTDMKRDEAILREARDRAEAGDRAKGQFLATMSHEVRTPLNGIVGFTGLLLETALNREQRDYVQTIRTSSEALIQLTGDILDFARIESGKLKLELQPCDPRDLVEDALDLLSGRAAEKNLELLHWVDAAVPAMIVADGGRLRQVLVILLNNAVKFTDAGEVEVRVTVEEQPDTPAAEPPRVVLKFTVRDTGIGIPVEQQGKLFKPFTQADESTTRRYGGTGLGLAISKNLVHLMNGDITLASEVGRGSTFAFSMQAAVGPAAPPSSSPLAGRRVALAARPGPLRTELAQLVTRAGAELIEADDPAGVENVAWDAGLIELDDTLARAFAVQPAPSPGLPPDKTCALVSLALPREVRAALKPHFRLLVNKPARHGALLDYLAGTGPDALPGEAEAVSFDLRVLLVEDNAVNQRLMQKVLSNLGCRFTVAVNGRLALAELAHPAEPYDLVLMDLHMPEMDGLTAITKIRGGEAGPQAQGVWLVALTADARDDQKERILTAGANDFLTKPLKLSELDAALRKFLAARKARPAK
jgi:PAS domain S-box-containing protein